MNKPDFEKIEKAEKAANNALDAYYATGFRDGVVAQCVWDNAYNDYMKT